MSTPMNPEKWDRVKNKGVLPEECSNTASDWVKYYREGSDSKYGCLMYSEKIDRLRHVTFQEFYEGGIVD